MRNNTFRYHNALSVINIKLIAINYNDYELHRIIFVNNQFTDNSVNNIQKQTFNSSHEVSLSSIYIGNNEFINNYANYVINSIHYGIVPVIDMNNTIFMNDNVTH